MFLAPAHVWRKRRLPSIAAQDDSCCSKETDCCFLSSTPVLSVQLSRLLVSAYGERAAALARGLLPLHDTAFDALQQACAQAAGSPGPARPF